MLLDDEVAKCRSLGCLPSTLPPQRLFTDFNELQNIVDKKLITRFLHITLVITLVHCHRNQTSLSTLHMEIFDLSLLWFKFNKSLIELLKLISAKILCVDLYAFQHPSGLSGKGQRTTSRIVTSVASGGARLLIIRSGCTISTKTECSSKMITISHELVNLHRYPRLVIPRFVKICFIKTLENPYSERQR